jgi:putative membrane protein
MPIQWSLFLSLVFALIVAIFSLSNVEEVPVNFLFMDARIPLILLILSSALAGAMIVGLYGIFRQYKLQREIKRLNEMVEVYKEKSDDLKTPAAQTDTKAKDTSQASSAVSNEGSVTTTQNKAEINDKTDVTDSNK